MNDYSKKTEAELLYIMKDAAEAATAMKGWDGAAEAKYLDQLNDAATELHRRKVRAEVKRGRLNSRILIVS